MKHKSHHEAKVVAETTPQSSETEESDCTATESSSISDHLHKKRRKSTTQFSVSRSDADGLRMKISAIRRKTTDSRNDDNKHRSDNNNIEPKKFNNDKMLAPMEAGVAKLVTTAGKSYCPAYVRESDSRSEASSTGKIKKLKLKRKKTIKHHDFMNQLPFGVISHNPQTLLPPRAVRDINNSNQIRDRPLSSFNQPPVLPDDNIGLSSSDNELPALVNAAIKCVESDSDSHSLCIQPKIQYTSTLLEDFMAKTQMLSQSADKEKRNNIEIATTSTANSSLLTQHNELQILQRKKRGRPKKAPNEPIVNESADSGVVSSTAQSTSPSPKNHIERSRSSQNAVKVVRHILPPKTDTNHLDRRRYAMSERVLNPSPRTKPRKQLVSTTSKHHHCSTSMSNKQQAGRPHNKHHSMDPVWRKIDANAKVRRPSVNGYKSDGGGFTNTVCSKILSTKSGYTSDYSVRNNNFSGYKSDVSCKSRCSMKSSYSRTSRAKSCDGKHRTKYRRKRRPTMSQSKSVVNLNDQDILQLAGLSLGQTSEESSDSVGCKPKLLVNENETTNIYKKYGEINRFITTGEYFGRSKQTPNFPSGSKHHVDVNNVDQDSEDTYNFLSAVGTKVCSRSRKGSLAIELPIPINISRKLKSRRSSVASFCSSFQSGTSRVKRRHRKKGTKYGCSKMMIIDSKLLTEIEIITNSFPTMCRIHCDKPIASGYTKERIAPQKPFYQNKRNLKKRKLSENMEYVLSNGLNPTITTSKRRHKKTCSSSPDDHKLPLKKRHYLMTSGDKTEKAAVAFASEPKANSHVVKPTGRSVSTRAAVVTPKKRHLLQTSTADARSNSPNYSNDSRLYSARSTAAAAESAPTEVVNNKKRTRLESVVSKIACTSGSVTPPPQVASTVASGNENSFPPPGVFEPSIELEIQIPISKLSDNAIITKAEAASPLDLLDLHNKTFPEASSNGKAERVVESLLNKTGCNFLLRRKRKKINRTGFPNVKRKKRKVSEFTSASVEPENKSEGNSRTQLICDRVPQTGETSATFLERTRPPRLSVVSLERLQGTNKKQILREATPSRNRSSKTSNLQSKNIPKKLAKKDKPRPLSKKKTPAGEQQKVVANPLLNMRFPNCKIRLKRRPNLALVNTKQPASETVSENRKQIIAVAKTTPKKSESEGIVHLEQEPLPLAAFSDVTNAIDSESSSSISVLSEDSKSTLRKQKWKKSYLVAGLLSDYFKVLEPVRLKKLTPLQVKETNYEPAVLPLNLPLLPAPPYCEKYFRRTESDFQLPYDIWWSYINGKLPTRETVPSWNYKKIRTNVYRCAEVRPNTNNIDLPTCNCKQDIGCGDDCLNRMVYTECSPSSCPTREKCKNQKIQRHEVAPGVERFMTENKGWGVRTKLPIKKGTYILEYVGEVVTEKEFKDRMATMYINDTHHYCLHLDGGLVIDGHRMGSDGRFVNHSCSPNCEMQKWSVNGLSRMALFAARNIEAGEEISYDYNFSLFNPSEGQECRCNTPQCRGVIGGKSQRIKPLIEVPKPVDTSSGPTDGRRIGRQRKRQQGSARKDVIRLQSKDIIMSQMVQQLSEKDKRLIALQKIFLVRNFEKVRRIKAKRSSSDASKSEQAASAALPRRPSTPSSIAVQISALRSPRSIQTRGLAQAVQDPEVEKMAKMAVVLRNICSALEGIKDGSDKPEIIKLHANFVRKKGKPPKQQQQCSVPKLVDFSTIQSNIEKGYYKVPSEFDDDVENLLSAMRDFHKENPEKLLTIKQITELYIKTKDAVYDQLVELVVDKISLKRFRPCVSIEKPPATGVVSKNFSSKSKHTKATTEDIISCICGLYKDEGLMIQCARCNVWQHTECTKADVNADSYLCEKCDSRVVDREIPLDEFTDDGHRYYLSLMRGDLQIRQGDTVYVLRDLPIKDANGVVCSSQKHTYQTIGVIDYSQCDIFRVERLWKDENGKRVIYGHHFLRPHETFHEPSRRFYPNEVVRVPLYELVSIELVIGRCWVLDKTTFCKGRPADCTSEEHVFICELRVDRTARVFSKVKINWPTCTKSFAFRKFDEKLKIFKTYSPHDVDPAFLKSGRRPHADLAENTPTTPKSVSKNVSPQRKSHAFGAIQKYTLVPLLKTRKQKRSNLELVLAAIKTKKSKQNDHINEEVVDVSYLLSGRGARNRKSMAANVPT